MKTESQFDIQMDASLLDSLLAHIGFIDSEGILLKANNAWKTFGNRDTDFKRTQEGENHFETLQAAIEKGNDYALKMLLGIRKVIKGEKESFSLSYPIQTKPETYWFNLTVRPCDDYRCYMLIHEDITTSMRERNRKQELKNRYQVQFEQSLDGILITDTKGTVIDANPAACNLLGRKCPELIGSRREDIMDVTDANYQQALSKRKSKGTYQLETAMIHKNGSLIPVEITSRAYRNHEGKLRAIVSFRDISRRKKAEEDLQQNQRFTELALNSIPGVFLVLDKNGNLVRWNKQMFKELGYSKEELNNKNALDFIVEEEREKVQQKMAECIKTGHLSVETKVTARDGSVKDYFLFAKRFVEKGEPYIVGAGLDITDSKITERENRRHRLMLQQLFENAPVGIAIVDTKNKIQQVNKSFEKIFEYSQEEVMNRNINKLIVPQHKFSEAATISSVTRDGESLQTETVRLSKNNKRIPVLVGGIPVKVEDEVIAIYGMYVDITDQREYQQKIERALQEKNVLLAELHHRVKNNLALINSLLELQLFDSSDQKLTDELTSVKNRILTIASIHEVLYRNGNLTNIPFGNFLEEFTSSGTMLGETVSKAVQLEYDADNIYLDIDQSIPAGLLVNELLSLIFSVTDESSASHIAIKLREYDTRLHLVIEGDHMLPCPAKARKESSLSNVLINTLVKQLDGVLLWPNQDETYQKFECIFTKRNGCGPARELIEQTL